MNRNGLYRPMMEWRKYGRKQKARDVVSTFNTMRIVESFVYNLAIVLKKAGFISLYKIYLLYRLASAVMR
jgi:hypothetical protein